MRRLPALFIGVPGIGVVEKGRQARIVQPGKDGGDLVGPQVLMLLVVEAQVERIGLFGTAHVGIDFFDHLVERTLVAGIDADVLDPEDAGQFADLVDFPFPASS